MTLHRTRNASERRRAMERPKPCYYGHDSTIATTLLNFCVYASCHAKSRRSCGRIFSSWLGVQREITVIISAGASIPRHLRAGARGTHMLRLHFAKALLGGEVTGPLHRLRDENPHPAWARQASSDHVQSSDALLSCTYTASHDKSRQQPTVKQAALG